MEVVLEQVLYMYLGMGQFFKNKDIEHNVEIAFCKTLSGNIYMVDLDTLRCKIKLVHNHEIELGLREFDIQKNEKHYHLS